MMTPTNGRILQILACPVDGRKLRQVENRLACEQGHAFPIEGGVPVFAGNPRREQKPQNMAPCVIDPASPVDPFVNDWIVNTNGNLYWRVRGRLPHYPIPSWPDQPASDRDKVLVDLGCGWGRWSMSAAQAGYLPVGVDIHLDALQAAARVAAQNGQTCGFVCSEIDRLPFQDSSVDCVFSYSVLQHLERDKVGRAVADAHRILKPGGKILIQLPNASGIVSILQQWRRGGREARPDSFEMRYWSRQQMMNLLCGARFGTVTVRADGFFSQNPQPSDLPLLSLGGRAIVRTSHALSRLATTVPPLARIADSLWVMSSKNA